MRWKESAKSTRGVFRLETVGPSTAGSQALISLARLQNWRSLVPVFLFQARFSVARQYGPLRTLAAVVPDQADHPRPCGKVAIFRRVPSSSGKDTRERVPHFSRHLREVGISRPTSAALFFRPEPAA